MLKSTEAKIVLHSRNFMSDIMRQRAEQHTNYGPLDWRDFRWGTQIWRCFCIEMNILKDILISFEKELCQAAHNWANFYKMKFLRMTKNAVKES